MVYICNPNNPTGTVVARKQLDDYFKRVPDHVVTVVDEAYFDYNQNHETCSSVGYLALNKPLLVNKSFSKMYGLISARIGYGIGGTEIIQNMEKCRPPMNVNLAAEVGALASVDDDAAVAQRSRTNMEQRQYLHGELERIGLEYTPSEANCIFVNVAQDSMDVWAKLMTLGVLVRPGKTYDCPTWLRVTIGTPEENKVFIHALRKVLGKVKGTHGREKFQAG
jgi:histidinol-phosphate aminotransferase